MIPDRGTRSSLLLEMRKPATRTSAAGWSAPQPMPTEKKTNSTGQRPGRPAGGRRGAAAAACFEALQTACMPKALPMSGVLPPQPHTFTASTTVQFTQWHSTWEFGQLGVVERQVPARQEPRVECLVLGIAREAILLSFDRDIVTRASQGKLRREA